MSQLYVKSVVIAADAGADAGAALNPSIAAQSTAVPNTFMIPPAWSAPSRQRTREQGDPLTRTASDASAYLPAKLTTADSRASPF